MKHVEHVKHHVELHAKNALRALSAVIVIGAAGCAKNIPIPDVKVSADEAKLARGKYLAESGMACIVCHSRRDWSHFGGPVIAGSEYGGSDDIGVNEGFPEGWHFGAPNLTPHHLKDWSDGEIVRATLLGQDRDRHGLFPIMPYMLWRDDIPIEDALDVVTYLRTLPALDHDAPARKIPIPGFVLDTFPQPRDLKATAPKPGDATYGAYVVARAGCRDCHTDANSRNEYVEPIFAGGREFPVPKPGKGFVRSANLTPDDSGLGKWTKEMFIAKFKSSTLEVARATPLDDTGFNSIMPWWAYAGLSDEDLGAMWDYFQALPPTKNVVEKWSLTSKKPK